MDLWFELSEVRRVYHAIAVPLMETYVNTGSSPFPREHTCLCYDRDLRLVCIAWAGYGIEQVGPAHNYNSQLVDLETGQVAQPDEFMDTPAGRAGVWTARLIAAVGNGNLQLVSDLTAAEMPELDTRAEALLIGVGLLTAERRLQRELAEIERKVLTELGPGDPASVLRKFPAVPTPPPIPGWRGREVPRGWFKT